MPIFAGVSRASTEALTSSFDGEFPNLEFLNDLEGDFLTLHYLLLIARRPHLACVAQIPGSAQSE